MRPNEQIWPGTSVDKSICHRDGTVSYWSVFQQAWKTRQERIPSQELAAMGEKERRRVMRHLGEEY